MSLDRRETGKQRRSLAMGLRSVLMTGGLMIAWTVEMTSACPPDLLPDTFWNFTNYKADSQELQLLPPDPIPGDTWSCFEKLESSNSSLDLRLVRVTEGGQDCVGLRSCPGGKRVGCCSECAASPGPPTEFRLLQPI